MAATILEALQNANHNLDNMQGLGMFIPLVKFQLNIAVVLLEKGYSIYTEVEPLITIYGDVDNVPDKTNR